MSKRLAWLLTGNLRTNMLVWVTIVVCYVLFPRRLPVPCGGSVPIATRSLSLLSALFKRLLLWVAFWTLVSLPSFTSFFFLAWLSSLVPYYPFPPACCIVCMTPESHRPWLPYAASQIQTETKCHTNIFAVTHSYNTWRLLKISLSCCHSQMHLHSLSSCELSVTELITGAPAYFLSVLNWTKRSERVLLYTATPFYSCS